MNLIHGKNYVETLLLTLTQFEMMNPKLDVREYIVKRLEEEVVALSRAIPYIKNIYRDFVKEILEKEFRDIPLPDLTQSDYLYDIVLDWMKRNARYILREAYFVMYPTQREERLREQAIRIVRTALMATLYKCGIVSFR